VKLLDVRFAVASVVFFDIGIDNRRCYLSNANLVVGERLNRRFASCTKELSLELGYGIQIYGALEVLFGCNS